MAVVHMVNVALRKVDALGNVLDKNDPAETLKQHMQFSHQHRIIPDSNIPNSINSPTVSDYIAAEAADDFIVQHLDQYVIITYKRDTNGGFPAS
jgi:hypothetical protein